MFNILVPRLFKTQLWTLSVKNFQAGQIRAFGSTFMKVISKQKNRMKPQSFDFFLVLDFEATCQRGPRLYPQEVIEFPCLLVSGENFEIKDTFHRYVRPMVHSELTPFCVELTGIVQDMVEDEEDFKQVQSDFLKWFNHHDLNEKKFTFVTCGDWDLADMLPHQCQHANLEPFTRTLGVEGKFINIKYSFRDHLGIYPRGLPDMLKHLGINFQGRLHSGIDDCKNIVTILKCLAEKGYVFANNGSMNAKVKSEN